MTPADIAAEYAAAAKAWRAQHPSRVVSEEAPLAVLLLMSHAETGADNTFTGDMIGDLLAGISETVERWYHAIENESLSREDVRAITRRLDVVRELRRRERAAQGSP